MIPADWHEKAACRGADTELFYPDARDEEFYGKSVCRRCPVRAACAAEALATGERWGIRAGIALNPKRTARQRVQLQRIAEGVAS